MNKNRTFPDAVVDFLPVDFYIGRLRLNIFSVQRNFLVKPRNLFTTDFYWFEKW